MESTALTTINVTCATPSGSVQSTIKASLPLDTPWAKPSAIVQPEFSAWYRNTPGRLALNVTTGASTYAGNLQINIEEPLAQYYKDYRRFHGRALGAKSLSEANLESRYKTAFRKKKEEIVGWNHSTITVDLPGSTSIAFFNRQQLCLPPNLGTFPIVEAQDYAATLPDYIKQRGGYLMPLFQREALWMSIGGGPCAIKNSVGGINTITGD
ncbi:hypothetical protein DFH08DRAFT_337941 [Mycena albidolilacea]|uniref:Uncharacterized protein n=1 Tax=Mycena albidolilacea TaxID=1033008 RepID=A0AAD6ZK15_9AGAR|nr:hypothetical protein DFH08DRAFT_337941 [Mycena albidolilacea]